MAIPLTADQTLATLRKWGLRYREVGNWRTHNRSPRTWGPVYGFGVHHTGDDAPDAIDQAVIVNGRAGLPGPLAQFGLNDDGTVDLIGCGRANHFGGGDPNVLAAVRSESYGDYPPASHFHDGSPGAADGNASFYGVETYYSGAQAPKQYRAMVLLAAAICDAHGWSEKSVIGHKEWSDWKPDPGSVDMAQFRRDVAACHRMGPQAASAWCYGTTLAPGSSSAGGGTAPSKPNPQEGFLMALSDAQQGDVLFATTQRLPEGRADGRKVNGQPTRVLDTGDGQTIRNDIAGVKGIVTGMAAAIQALASGQAITADEIEKAAYDGAARALADQAASEQEVSA